MSVQNSLQGDNERNLFKASSKDGERKEKDEDDPFNFDDTSFQFGLQESSSRLLQIPKFVYQVPDDWLKSGSAGGETDNRSSDIPPQINNLNDFD